MATTHENSLFSGFKAISDAGGVDGFLREVLAETKTKVGIEATARGISQPAGLRVLIGNTASEIICRRLKPEYERLMDQALKRITRKHSRKPRHKLMSIIDGETLGITWRMTEISEELLRRLFQLANEVGG